MYTLLGNVNKFYAGNIKILIDLFDKMIVTICTYNCEVWGLHLSALNPRPAIFYQKINLKTQQINFKDHF